MAQNKTQPTPKAVSDFIAGIEDETKRTNCEDLVKLMSGITGEAATMWGASMVGFGSYHYKYASGREGDFFLTGFSPRKQALSIYIVSGFGIAPDLMEKLGSFKIVKSCLYVKSLDDIDRVVLAQLIEKSVKHLREKYPV